MTAEQLCVTLDKARELKENGYPQDDSCFVWVNHLTWDDYMGTSLMDRNEIPMKKDEGMKMVESYVAPTLAEILEKLPPRLKIDDWWHELSLYRFSSGVELNYLDVKEHTSKIGWHVAADLWLRLKKDGLIK